MPPSIFAPGARVLIRDAEWLVRRVDRTSTGKQAVAVVGLSELVKDKEAIFLEEIDQIDLLDPADTNLVADTSPFYRDSILFMESLLRQTPPTDEHLYIGHQGASDTVPYQLDPAIVALRQPRQRILIADAVGLGKTIEAGILIAELIKRGKGKRILVLTVKSMMTQFQKELWSRFTIPLVRLDSIGIQRVRSRIPTNHNPFYYFDKSIISIDTLKQDGEYRTYLEKCYWDIIVIDECHNVAERGSDGSHSQRAKLAKLLASRSDTLLLLSATPHDGKAKSFASLMNMLNPTAIANPEDYGPDDIKGLFIRRFKKDIKEQVSSSFRERKVAVAKCPATHQEEAAFEAFSALTFTKIDQRRTAGKLFKTTLEKGLFSSPVACRQTIARRTQRLSQEDVSAYGKDIEAMDNLADLLADITPKEFAKYQKLIEVIRDPKQGFGWTGKDTRDRLVIFSERIETIKFLDATLKNDLGLKDEQVSILHGGLSDIDQQHIVEEFGRDESKLRLLLASDVASEGINLHFLCHRMIHFDIPWSLMVFQQRNGRIDRYGQEREPQIVYLMTESNNNKIKGDNRILELLIQKDEMAAQNIGDPSALMGVYDIEQEELFTAAAIEEGDSPDDFEERLKKVPKDPLGLLMDDIETPKGTEAPVAQKSMLTLFDNDFSYLQDAVGYIRRQQPLQADFDVAKRTVNLVPPDELKNRFKTMPPDIWPDTGEFILCADRQTIMDEIRRTRREEHTWPRIHLLWEQHPVMQWVNDKLLAAFGRQQAPVLTLPGKLAPGEVVFILSGLIPNRKSHPLIQHWLGVRFINNQFADIAEFTEVVKRTGLGTEKIANRSAAFSAEALSKLLPQAISQATTWMGQRRKDFEAEVNPKLEEQYAALEKLRGRHVKQLLLFDIEDGGGQQDKKAQRQREIDRIFDEYIQWIEDTMVTEETPYIRVVAVLRGDD